MTDERSDDVLIVGGGLEGYIAALSVARLQPQAQIRLLETSTDRFDYHSGLIDILGYLPTRGGEPVERPYAAYAELPTSHPYHTVGMDRLRQSLAFFDAEFEYPGSASEENALLITASGQVTPAARYPPAMAPGVLSREEPLLLVGFEEIVDFDVEQASHRLSEQLPYDVGGFTIQFPESIAEYPATDAIATQLDSNSSSVDGMPLRDVVISRIEPQLDIEPRIGLPAVLGLSAHEQVRRELESGLHSSVFEVPTGPPSVPGRRLQSRLRARAQEASITIETDRPTGVKGDGDEIEAVSGERRYSADQFILATGGVGAGGLVADGESVSEPVFDCHVEHPSDRRKWTHPQFFGDQPFVRFGVDISEELQPLGSDGEPQYSNLRAAGSVIGGIDYVAEQSADGIAIATGYTAGILTAESL